MENGSAVNMTDHAQKAGEAPEITNTIGLIPQAYREPLRALARIRAQRNLDIIPISTVDFVFIGYRFSHVNTRAVILELHALGIIELVPYTGIRLRVLEE
jgi:hypothetical protein